MPDGRSFILDGTEWGRRLRRNLERLVSRRHAYTRHERSEYLPECQPVGRRSLPGGGSERNHGGHRGLDVPRSARVASSHRRAGTGRRHRGHGLASRWPHRLHVVGVRAAAVVDRERRRQQRASADQHRAGCAESLVGRDGRWIYFDTVVSAGRSIYRIAPDGSGIEQITRGAMRRIRVSPDGSTVFLSLRQGGDPSRRGCRLRAAIRR